MANTARVVCACITLVPSLSTKCHEPPKVCHRGEWAASVESSGAADSPGAAPIFLPQMKPGLADEGVCHECVLRGMLHSAWLPLALLVYPHTPFQSDLTFANPACGNTKDEKRAVNRRAHVAHTERGCQRPCEVLTPIFERPKLLRHARASTRKLEEGGRG